MSYLSKPVQSCFEETLANYYAKRSPALSCLSAYQCYKPQKIHQVPFNQSTLLVVAKGQKEVQFSHSELILSAGDCLLILADTTVTLSQLPNSSQHNYLGLVLRFDSDAIKHFRLIYGSLLDQWDLSTHWHKQVPENIVKILIQWITISHEQPTNKLLQQLKQVEILLLLAQQGLVGAMIFGQP